MGCPGSNSLHNSTRLAWSFLASIPGQVHASLVYYFWLKSYLLFRSSIRMVKLLFTTRPEAVTVGRFHSITWREIKSYDKYRYM